MKPTRYIVRASDGTITSYNIALDALGTSAESQAKYTAKKYGGELLVDYGDGQLVPYTSTK